MRTFNVRELEFNKDRSLPARWECKYGVGGFYSIVKDNGEGPWLAFYHSYADYGDEYIVGNPLGYDDYDEAEAACQQHHRQMVANLFYSEPSEVML